MDASEQSLNPAENAPIYTSRHSKTHFSRALAGTELDTSRQLIVGANTHDLESP